MQTTAHEIAFRLSLQSDDVLILQTASVALLTAAASGKVDLNKLAREELAARGLDIAGRWVGFANVATVTHDPTPDL